MRESRPARPVIIDDYRAEAEIGQCFSFSRMLLMQSRRTSTGCDEALGERCHDVGDGQSESKAVPPCRGQLKLDFPARYQSCTFV
jgi:hypothetical protein